MMEQILKRCSKCGEEKHLSEFYKDKYQLDGFTVQCKQCQKEHVLKNKDKILEYGRKYRLENKEFLSEKAKTYYQKNKHIFQDYANKNKDKIKKQMIQWLLDNKEILKIKRKKYYLENKELISLRDKKYSDTHKEQKRQYNKEYQKKNKDKIRIQVNESRRLRFKTDINYKITEYLRTRTRAALNKNYKSGRTLELLGCSIEFFRTHLESQFTEGMSWENYGLNGWVIDHRLPCCSFDLSKPSEQQTCFHYTNLQPLWWKENQEKISSDKKLKYRI